jgi:anthranilate phosphoribosyltransferase
MSNIEKTIAFGAKVQQLIQGQDLSREETFNMFKEVLLDQQPELQQGAFLSALAAKGETAAEIAGAWEAINQFDTEQTRNGNEKVLVENSGTGMDTLKTFNVSSAAAIVAAACGVSLARHGARALTSKYGTVDILEAVGVDVEWEIATVEKSIDESGIGLFNGMSPKVHPGALGRILSQIRFGSTLNIAASLANPANPSIGLRGVYSPDIMDSTAKVMSEIGYKRGMVVHGLDQETGKGMDELSICGPTMVCMFDKDGKEKFQLNPEELGIRKSDFSEISALGNLEEEKIRFVQVLAGKGHEACVQFTSLNAGAILYISQEALSIEEGMKISRDAIDNGSALKKLKQWVAVQDDRAGQGTSILKKVLEEAGV